MPWYFYAFLSAILLSLSSLVEKKVLHKVHSTSFSTSLALLNFVFSLPFIFFIDFSGITRSSLVVTFLVALFAAISFLFVAKALRHMDISVVSPVLALNPGASALAAFVILGEKLSQKDILGIALMVIGSYVLMTATDGGIRKSIKHFFSSKYAVFLLLSIIFYALTSPLDRFIVADLSIDPMAYLFFAQLFIAVIFVVIATGWHSGIKGVADAMRADGKEIALISICTVAYRYFQLVALQTAFVGLVSTIKRSSSFFTTIIGGEMFHEDRLLQKSISAIIIIAGCLLVVF